MGSLFSCLSEAAEAKQRQLPPGHRRPRPVRAPQGAATALGSSDPWRRSGRNERAEEALTDEQALAAAATILLQQNGGVPLPFDRSSSLRYPGQGQKKQALPRSSSTRARSLVDPVVQPQHLVNQDLKVDELESSFFVLVHGGGFGAWCWYKTIALLEDSGFKVNAIDLTGSGIHSFDTNKITSLAEYVEPLATFLKTLPDGEKVILVGHDFGGACISYAMEMYPTKVSKAVFLCAAMPANGQSTFDMLSQQVGTNDLLQKAQIFVYSNGKDQAPTAINLDKTLLKDLLFNQTSSKDVSLASVSMRPIPFAPVLEKLSLTEENYNSVRRYYIETTDDNAITLPLQQSMCSSSSLEKVFRLKGSDHSPFFSKPQALHKLLVEIARTPSAATAFRAAVTGERTVPSIG